MIQGPRDVVLRRVSKLALELFCHLLDGQVMDLASELAIKFERDEIDAK